MSQQAPHTDATPETPAPESLTDAQLLNLCLLGHDLGQNLLTEQAFADLIEIHCSLPALLSATAPIPDSRAAPCHPRRLRSLQQLHLRLQASSLTPAPGPVNTTESLAALLMPRLGALEDETLVALPVTADLALLPVTTVAVGQPNAVRATPAQIFRPAVNLNAPLLFLAHNHPHGSPEPSPHDWAFTKRMLAAAKLLDLTLLDHIVIAGDRYRSMR